MTAHGDGFINGGGLFSFLAAAGCQRQGATQDHKYKI
jgi:hypothetical protein